MANYEKLTPDSFVEKLKAGGYESLTGARRAVGKANWSDAEKDKGREKALKHFGGEGSTPKPAKKTATKKAPAAKTAGVKETKAKASRKADPATAKAPPFSERSAEALQQVKSITMADVRKNPHAIIQLAEHGVQSGTNVLNAMTALKIQHPATEIGDTVEAASETIKASFHLISLVLGSLSEGFAGSREIVTPAHAEPIGTTNGVAGPVEAATAGTPMYEAPASSNGTAE